MSTNWIQDVIVELVAEDKGYAKGFADAAGQIFRDIDKLHLYVANEYEAMAYEELKKKYGVK
jgi:hypothetical protein